jgi:hypothetical protein
MNGQELASELKMPMSYLSSIANKPSESEAYQNRSTPKNMERIVKALCDVYSKKKQIFFSSNEVEQVLRSGTLTEEDIKRIMLLLPASIPEIYQPSKEEIITQLESDLGCLEELEAHIKDRLDPKSVPADFEVLAKLHGVLRDMKNMVALLHIDKKT